LAGFNFFKRSIVKKDLNRPEQIDITDDSLKGIGSGLAGLSNQYAQYLDSAPRDTRSDIYDSVDFIDKYDEVISKVLSDMADDATQYSFQTKSPLWITSDDKDLERELNNLIEVLDLKIKITSIVREVIKYGDKFGRLVIDPNEGITKLIVNSPPRSVCRLEYKGELVGYKIDTEAIPLQRYEMIHWRSLEEYVKDDILLENNKELFTRYFLDENPSYGKSYVYRAISISKRLKYAEDAVLLGRLSKSKLYRNHFVEVGTGTLKEKIKIMREYIRNWRKNSAVNTENKDMYSEENFFSYEEDVFHPVSDGKGSSSIDQVGGEMDIAHIEDIEYFSGKRNKVIGVSDDTSPMTNRLQEDSKYAKKVSGYQKYLLRGLYELFDIHLDVLNKYSEERKYSINLVEVDSYVETERNEMLSSSADFVEKILTLIDSVSDKGVPINLEYLTKYLFENYLRLPDFNYEELFKAVISDGENQTKEDIQKKLEALSHSPKSLSLIESERGRVSGIRHHKVEVRERGKGE